MRRRRFRGIISKKLIGLLQLGLIDKEGDGWEASTKERRKERSEFCFRDIKQKQNDTAFAILFDGYHFDYF